ncbi:MAG: thioredoxin domain-containing protein [Deinococcus sp.]|nr:thioredoxin domain-containing protein [Deinococcus sp.]
MSAEKPNRLAQESSAYLKSAAHQPVQWYPWGEEAFQKAQQEDKPILLDIGAVWCHWCHVIDRESYDDPELAQLINQLYVPVKVDRDQRPDVDARYQQAVQALTGAGGWPLTGFLTPIGDLYYGGTYFPPREMYGRPSFRQVLTEVARFYQERKQDAVSQGEKIRQALAQPRPVRDDISADPRLIQHNLELIKDEFDEAHGGFGTAPKFPHPSAIALLLQRHWATGEEWMLHLVRCSLTKMAKGGVYDQLAGGFHRYSVDERWVVPHFEKMLYDNAGLLSNYLQAYRATGDRFLAEVARDIVCYIDEVLSDQDHGGFYGSQDADVGPNDDGDYFTWTMDEAKAVLTPDEFVITQRYYNIYQQGEMHKDPRRNVLFVDEEPEHIARDTAQDLTQVRLLLASAKGKMLAARAKRPTPFVDKTIYVGWNALMIQSYLEAATALELGTCRNFALKSLERILAEAMRPDGSVSHQLGREGRVLAPLLEDQAQLGLALLHAHQVTGKWEYLQRAVALADYMLTHHWDEAGIGFFDRPQDAQGIGWENQPYKPIIDGPTPAPNAAAALLLLKLHAVTGRERYQQRAEETLHWIAAQLPHSGLFGAAYLLALDTGMNPPPMAVVVGAPQEATALHQALLRVYRPGSLVITVEAAQLNQLPPYLQAMVQSGKPAMAYICAGNACAAPTSDSSQAGRLLASFGRS